MDANKTTHTITISDILAKFREMSSSKREQGYLFEKFTREYLRHNPKYGDLAEIWLWSEFPYRNKQTDTGIDLVARTETGEYWAIQCKFFQEDKPVGKGDVDSFLAASSKTFLDDQGQKRQYVYRLLVVTSDLTANALEELKEQAVGCGVLDRNEFDLSRIDWDKFWNGFCEEIIGKNAPRISAGVLAEKKKLREYQKKAIDEVVRGFETSDRGRLIMACGTGKTFTSLKMAERLAGAGGCVLYLVPSLSLMAQTLSVWTADSEIPISPMIVCSDAEVHRQDARRRKALSDDIAEGTSLELARPATTNPARLAEYHQEISSIPEAGGRLKVVFSTYQSIDVIAKAQAKHGLPEFDLIVCDEAHRTTGVTLAEEDESAFTKVHDNETIRGKKRLYMTATPRFYGESAKSKAKENDAVLCSMDDITTYGPEFHRLSFGDAVKMGILADYKVIVLTVSEKYARTIADQAGGGAGAADLSTDEITKLVGCWNGLRKKSRYALPDGTLSEDFSFDPEPMRRAVMFAKTIKVSKMLAPAFTELTEKASQIEKPKNRLLVEVKHVDGTMGANLRKDALDWLEAGTEADRCRVLSNVRCLGEGVDVPSLDAVIFLSPRKSQVEVVQAVGRVMRTAPNKKYGYVILPVVIPADKKPEEVLDDDKRFKVVWQVLNALRSHDERFNVWINQLNFKDCVPPSVNPFLVGGVAYGGTDRERDGTETLEKGKKGKEYTPRFDFDPESGKKILARVVAKCGDRAYFENWAREVAEIAKSRIEQIKEKLSDPTAEQRAAFDQFVAQMRADINPSIGEDQAIEMLVQHMVMEPVFSALFPNNEFVRQNVMSRAIAKVIGLFQPQDTEQQKEQLANFKLQVAFRVAGVQSAEGRQKAVHDLYENFFKAAARAAAERLGIVYTPIEVVDYIVRSADALLKKHFNRRLSNKTVHVLDPFTGTGTFIVRLLQSGLIDKADLLRKCREELHANEIVLLAYYIAAINIEETMRGFLPGHGYEPFPGLLLTDTFQMEETPLGGSALTAEEDDRRNDERIRRQRRQTIEVIIGNPPYSVGQRSANDNNQNLSYPTLDKRVEETYVAGAAAANKKGLYDSYIKAFRWASDRIKDRGIVAFVTNGGWLDANAMDGFRQCLEEEFSEVYVFDLRGNARTSGERRRKEKDNVFGVGTRTPVTVTLLVKKSKKPGEKARIFYHDIGDYLTREEKLAKIRSFGSAENTPWEEITPNEHHDWVKQRGEVFKSFYTIGDKQDKTGGLTVFKPYYSLGIQTNRDAWCYNFSESTVRENMRGMIECYNNQVSLLLDARNKVSIDDIKELDPTKIKWSSSLDSYLERRIQVIFDKNKIVQSLYRPFCKQFLYYDDKMVHRPGLFANMFPEPDTENRVICIEGPSGTRGFSCIITDVIPDLHVIGSSQCFPLYIYKPNDENSLLDNSAEKYTREDGITDAFLDETHKKYGSSTITKKDIFYYIYGLFHAPRYREDYADDLRVSLARIPLVKEYDDFVKFSDIGRQLAQLHLNYDTPEKLKAAIASIDRRRGPRRRLREYPITAYLSDYGGKFSAYYRIEKMRFAKKGNQVDRSRILCNEKIAVPGIPERAYRYIVNGKSALEWVMERYAVATDKQSGIVNDPNLYDKRHPQYIVELVESVAKVSLLTMDLIEELPKLTF